MNRHHDQLDRLSDTDLLARLIWNEAKEETLQGKLAVAHVVMNRIKARSIYGSSISDVILRDDDLTDQKGSNRSLARISNDASNAREFALCKAIAELATRGHLKNDPTDGATHFHGIHSTPAWASKLVFQRQIGTHVFYRDPLVCSIEDRHLQPRVLAMGRQP
jgi:N-acetylmuramoyl-L-alanine amidase